MRLLCDECGSAIVQELEPCRNCGAANDIKRLPVHVTPEAILEMIKKIRAEKLSQNGTLGDIYAQDHIEPWDDDFDFD